MSAISNEAINVDLTISVWTGRKNDKKATGDMLTVSAAKSKNAAKVLKNIFADEVKLAQVVAISQSIRNWHYASTLPWSDSGVRLLPMSNFLQYKRELSEWEFKFDKAVDEFLTDYPNLINSAAFKMGTLFDRTDYPSASSLRRKFAIRSVFSPVPESGDFRVTAQNRELDELREQYEASYSNRLNTAMADVWKRMYETLEKLSTQLGFDQGRKKRIHASMVENARDLTKMLTVLNVTKDPALEHARSELEKVLIGMAVEDLRKNEDVRTQTKSAVDTILESCKPHVKQDTHEDEDDEQTTAIGEECADEVSGSVVTGSTNTPTARDDSGGDDVLSAPTFVDNIDSEVVDESDNVVDPVSEEHISNSGDATAEDHAGGGETIQETTVVQKKNDYSYFEFDFSPPDQQ